ncbi:hypothetical protein FBALC1_07418 [Flavobacteriales bacterium ALC-1]|nr:hypothetical protein FBALC1_07418 [Flavobacteriales bacterium ALC-1]
MKRNTIILITTLVIISLLIFGFVNRNNTEVISDSSFNSNDFALKNQSKAAIDNKKTPDLYYGVDARFAAINKVDVHNARTIFDFLNDGEKEQIMHINSVDVILVRDNQLSHISAYGTTSKFTDEQLKILQSTDYFSHFTVRTEFKSKNKETGKLEERFFGPHITVTPEKQATYVDGKETLLNYLKENSKESMIIIKDDKLGAIKLSFIISKDGIVKDVKHDAMTTGYPSIDKKMINLLENIPGKWIPAENAKGEKIEQELVFTLGPRDGC